MAEDLKKENSLTARAFWLMFAKTLGFAFTFILPPLLVRHLSQSEYGLFKQIFLVVNTAITVLPLGFGMSAYYFLPREQAEQRKQVVFNVLLFSLFVGALGCLALVLQPSLLTAVFNDATLAEYAPLIGVLILFWVVSSFLETVAVANQETRLSTAFIICAQLTKTLFMLAALLMFGTLRSLVYASLAQGILQTMLLLLYLNSRFPDFWRSFDWKMLRVQMSYALPLGLAGLLFTVQTDLHNYFVSHRFGPAEFAIYSVGCLDLPLVGLLRESINSVMIPRVSLLQKENETREIILLTARVMRKLAAFFFPVYVFFLVAGREFIAFLFTPAYLPSWPIFAINLTVLPLSIIALDPIMRAYAKHRYFLLKVRVVIFFILVAALWYGSLRYQLLGAVGAVVLVNLIERLAMIFKFGRVLEVSRRDLFLLKDVGKIAVAALTAGILTALLRSLMTGFKPFFVLAACGVVFTLAYLAVILLLRVVTVEELDLLRGKVDQLQRRVFWKRAADSLS
ncbi:MAG TPA: oligosaccharide flippase family protein [Pyrinomonadaceae bacterium]|jgi:O-antigen/teichoic acid export membrane protein